MCGITGIFGSACSVERVLAMVSSQRHRGPDSTGVHVDFSQGAGLGHNRLSIIDLSSAGRQPMSNPSESMHIAFNGEIYNYRELREELADYPYHSKTDTEVVLAAYQRWGADCLRRFTGMFAFFIWDSRTRTLFAARDRFGVKPLYYHHAADGSLFIASEIKAIHAAGVKAERDTTAWATYLTHGLHDHSSRTFWSEISALPPGHALTWRDGLFTVHQWYDLAAEAGTEFDTRSGEQIAEHYRELLREAVKLRFRSDVPVGIAVSGGLDSATLIGLIREIQQEEANIKAFTYITGDPRYDELPWTLDTLTRTRHPLVITELRASDVPELAADVMRIEDEPFGGIPTLAYAKLFETARSEGATVVLDGQGMDEQWGGYDYYASTSEAGLVQATTDRPVRADCLVPDFRRCAEPLDAQAPFPDSLRNLQYRDARYTKIPRALRFNDRASMRSSIELREPFLDHHLVEFAFRQRPELKIDKGVNKVLLRRIAAGLLPYRVAEAPKRPVQTPQREWLRSELREWANDLIETALAAYADAWLNPLAVRTFWTAYCKGAFDNSYFVWQWLSLGLAVHAAHNAFSGHADERYCTHC